MLSGSNRAIYWLSHYVIDVLTHTLPAITTIASGAYFGMKTP
jgi:ATP-binding cassette subfamily A (ABC1) protein 3